MAYICPHEHTNCDNCSAYRYDDDREEMACFGQTDEMNNDPPRLFKPKTIVIVPSKNLAMAEDRFEDTLLEATTELLQTMVPSDQISIDDIDKKSWDMDYRNRVKTLAYKLFEEIGFRIKSDGTPF